METNNEVFETAELVERYLLAALLTSEERLSNYIFRILPEYFLIHQHRAIFTKMLKMYSLKENINELTLSMQFPDLGFEYFCKLVSLAHSGVDIKHLLEQIRVFYVQRQFKSDCCTIIAELKVVTTYERVVELMDKMSSKVLDLSTTLGEASSHTKLLCNLISEVFRQLERGENVFNKMSSTYTELDNLLGGGFNLGDLVILAARPSMGKTALMVNFIIRIGFLLHSEASLKGIGVFSLEMTLEQLAIRILALKTGITQRDFIVNKKFLSKEFALVTKACASLSNLNIFFEESGMEINIVSLQSRIRAWVHRYNLRFIFIDYLQLIQLTHKSVSNNRNAELSTITRVLKSLARELSLTIVVLSQLSRAVETREDKHPRLSDLRDSGSIEQDADIVMFLYRKEYYNQNSTSLDDIGDESAAELIVAKNRHGRIGSMRFKFDSETGAFN